VKIAISGAHGTGKTTLAGAFAARYALTELPTPGRLMAAQGLPVNQDATVTSQALAWFIQVNLEESSTNWVSMRSLIDIWAYTALAAERHEPTRLERAIADEMQRATKAMAVGRYDLLFYLPPRIPLVADDVRSSDPAFQAAVDARIRECLAEWRVPYLEVDVTAADAMARVNREVERVAGERGYL